MTFSDDLRLKWSDFPSIEYEQRVARAQELMAADGLDVVVLTSGVNVEYFSGFQNGHWDSTTFPTGALLLHRDKNPVLVIPRFFSGTAWSTSWVTELAVFPEPHAAPRDFGKVLVDAVHRLAGPTPVVGFERGTHLSPSWNLDDLAYITERLVTGEMRSAANVIWGCRMIKSDRELERMQQLTAITDRAINAVRGDLALGQTEREIGSRLAAEMMKLGGDGISFRNIRAGSDRYHCSDSLPQDRAFIDGDLLIIDTGTMLGQYCTDVAYTTLFGPATDRHRHVYDITIRAQDAALAMCRPGVPASDVFQAAAAIIEESGLPTLDMIGHGIGMDIHEPAMLTPYNHEPLRAGTVLAVEPWLYDPTGLGVFTVEEHVVVTEDGPQLLSSIPRDELLEIR